MLRERIDSALKTAMKAKDAKLRVATLRLVNAAIKDRDIAARGEDRCEGVTDEEILAILTKMVQERAEIEIIREFLPRQLSADEIKKAVVGVISEYEASGLKDMGKCMGALKERYNGAMDFGQAGKLMKEQLT